MSHTIGASLGIVFKSPSLGTLFTRQEHVMSYVWHERLKALKLLRNEKRANLTGKTDRQVISVDRVSLKTLKMLVLARITYEIG